MGRKNKIIFIGGVPGTGKTTVALKLGSLLGIDQVISTDVVREVIRSMSKKEENPILFSTTHEAWKFFGGKNYYNIINGVIEHSKAIYKQIVHLVRKAEIDGVDIIIEGVHLIPEIMDFIKTEKSEIYYFLLKINNEKEHFRRFDYKNSKRTIFHEKWYSNFEIIKMINNWMIKEAKKRNLVVIENKIFLETMKKIIKILQNKPFKNEPLNRMRLCYR